MKEKILSPTYPESVEEGVIANWKKLEGEIIIQDEVLAEIETDKVVIEVVAANDGVMTIILKAEGEVVNSGEVIGEYEIACFYSLGICTNCRWSLISRNIFQFTHGFVLT